ncbi:hypothetical protein [Pseudomonas putida]|uniref:hypothetical protein n=1 Tax=Pseudomonas putida TaxID=303 RepID=UPI003D97713F
MKHEESHQRLLRIDSKDPGRKTGVFCFWNLVFFPFSFSRQTISVGASLLAKNVVTPRLISPSASSLTSIASELAPTGRAASAKQSRKILILWSIFLFLLFAASA